MMARPSSITYIRKTDEPQQRTKAEVADDRSRGYSLSTSPLQPFPASVALRSHQAEPRCSSHSVPRIALAQVRAYDGLGIVDELREEILLGFPAEMQPD